MYYHRILRVWVLDPFDCFLLSAIIGSFVANHLKNYLSEKKSMERLKNSIIKKSKLLIKSERNISERNIFNSTETRLEKIYRVALQNRGGEFENFQEFEKFQADHKFSNEVFKLAQEIEGLVQRLASFLKERELKGIAKIFFKKGRLILELILCKCNIAITYSLLTEGLSTQVMVITATTGGAAGFTISWFSAGASLVVPPVLISILLLRSVGQQIINQLDYLKFKKLVKRMLEDNELKQTIRAFFMEGEVPTTTTSIEMKPFDSDKNYLPEFNFTSDQTFEEFIKAKMNEELGLVENPTQEQLQQLIHRTKIKTKPKGKTVYFNDFIDEIAERPNGIIDAEIVNETIAIKVKNE